MVMVARASPRKAGRAAMAVVRAATSRVAATGAVAVFNLVPAAAAAGVVMAASASGR